MSLLLYSVGHFSLPEMREPIQDPGGALESRDSLTQVHSFAVTTVA